MGAKEAKGLIQLRILELTAVLKDRGDDLTPVSNRWATKMIEMLEEIKKEIEN